MTALPAKHVLFGAVALLGLGSSGAFLSGCRREAPSSSGDAGAVSAVSAADPADSGEAPGAGARSPEAPHANEMQRDAGFADPACDGAVVSLLAAAVDPRCSISNREWDALVFSAAPSDVGAREAGVVARATGLSQTAEREGDRIVVSLVNGGAAPVVVPLRFHPGRPELAFSVLAQVDKQAVFELAPPAHDAPTFVPRIADAGMLDARHRGPRIGLDDAPSITHVHSARIRLPPGGMARARLTIDPRVVRRLDRSCGDSGVDRSGSADAATDGECLPLRLPKGHVVLYVGQLVAPTLAGPPVRVDWDSP